MALRYISPKQAWEITSEPFPQTRAGQMEILRDIMRYRRLSGNRYSLYDCDDKQIRSATLSTFNDAHKVLDQLIREVREDAKDDIDNWEDYLKKRQTDPYLAIVLE